MPQPVSSSRLAALDVWRGAVMALMALDHTRDFVHEAVGRYDPTNLMRASPALFLTRWITHLCAPAFSLLAGGGAYLALARGQNRAALSRFLALRGLLLIALEVTWVRFGWQLGWDYRETTLLQVIWALGCSMIALAGLAWLPSRLVGLIGAILIAGHNLLDSVHPGGGPALRALWLILHERGTFAIAYRYRFEVLYPILPWIGVMAAGFGLGELFTLARPARRRALLGWGLALTAAFVALRAAGFYGDPQPWTARGGPLYQALAFLNCEKYPPSLLYLLMTLGPTLLALAWLDGARGWLADALATLGRVPLFFYLAHLPFAHMLAVILGMVTGRGLYAFPLWVVYAMWLVALGALYPLCRWYAGVKRRHPGGALRYL